VLKAGGEIETKQENIHEWHELGEGGPGFQLMTGRNCCSNIFLFIFISIICIIKFSVYLFSKLVLSIRAIFASLIQIIC
jgi:hypothetical protein